MDAGDAWNEAFQRMKKRNDNGKIADTIVKTNPEILNGLGMHPEEFSGLSAQDKANTILGVFQGQGYKKALLDISQLQSKGNLEDYKLQSAQRDDQGAERFTGAMKGFFNTPEAIRRPDARKYQEEQLLQSGMNPDDTYKIGRVLEGMGGTDPGTVRDLTGQGLGDYAFITESKTGAGTVVPKRRAVKAEKAVAPNESWIYDEDKDAFKKNLLKIDDPHVQQAVIGARRAYNMSIGKSESDLDKLIAVMVGGGKGSPTTPAAAAGPKVRKWNPETKRFE